MLPMPKAILFYDGLCGLCDRVVQFTLKFDREGHIQFVAIQSRSGQKLLMEQGLSQDELSELSTVFVLADKILYRRSRAIFIILGLLPFPWLLLSGFRVLPAFFTDTIYRGVARIRYRLFGRFDQCKIPTPDTRSRFME